MVPDYNMKVHMLKVHADKSVKSFECNQCGNFATHAERLLKAHTLKHHSPTEKRKLECEKCLKKFRYPSDLKKHKCFRLLESATLYYIGEASHR
jgi:hypothetical protein